MHSSCSTCLLDKELFPVYVDTLGALTKNKNKKKKTKKKITKKQNDSLKETFVKDVWPDSMFHHCIVQKWTEILPWLKWQISTQSCVYIYIYILVYKCTSI